MATIDKTGGAPTSGGIPYAALNKVFVMSNTVDLTAGPITAGDVYQCLAIPANTLVMQVMVVMITPATGTTLTATIGDGTSAAGWDASEDHKGAANTAYTSALGTDTLAASAGLGTYYAGADSIDVTYSVATAITAGPKFKIVALCAKMA